MNASVCWESEGLQEILVGLFHMTSGAIIKSETVELLALFDYYWMKIYPFDFVIFE